MKWTTAELADLKKTVRKAKNNKTGLAEFAEKSGRPLNNVIGKYYYMRKRKKSSKRKMRKAMPAAPSMSPIVKEVSTSSRSISLDMRHIKSFTVNDGMLTIIL